MGHYAEVTDGLVTNVAICEDDPDNGFVADNFADEQGWVSLGGFDPQPGIGWAYDGVTFVAPEPIEERQAPSPVINDPNVLNDLIEQVNAAQTLDEMKDAFLVVLQAWQGNG